MDVRANVRAIVKEVVETYLTSKGFDKTKRRIAIFLTNSTLHVEPILKTFSDLVQVYEVICLVDSFWNKLFKEETKVRSNLLLDDLTLDQINEAIKLSEVLVFLTPTYSLITRLALTMDDDLQAKVAIQYQLRGRPIVLVNDFLELSVSQQLEAPHPVQNRIQTYIRQIQQERVSWVPMNKLSRTLEQQLRTSRERQPVVLARHIEQASRNGTKVIIVPSSSLITPMAKDVSRDLSIKIEKRDN